MLTRKQHDLLEFIDQHLRQTGCSPSFEEMKDGIGLKSKSGIHRLISALEERGFLRRHRHRARALEVVRLPADAVPRAGTPAPGKERGVDPAATRGIKKKPPTPQMGCPRFR
jgi:repressor LexA